MSFHTASRRSQPPLALSVPLSRFTSRVGGGSAFFVRHHYAPVNMNHSSLLRDVVGFLVGGLLAAVASGVVLVLIYPLPAVPDPRNHTGEALLMLVLVMFFCGGFIGRRGFSADFISDLWPSVITAFGAALFLCILAGLSFDEIAKMLGFATIGIVTSAAVSLLLQRWFPLKIKDSHDA